MLWTTKNTETVAAVEGTVVAPLVSRVHDVAVIFVHDPLTTPALAPVDVQNLSCTRALLGDATDGSTRASTDAVTELPGATAMPPVVRAAIPAVAVAVTASDAVPSEATVVERESDAE